MTRTARLVKTNISSQWVKPWPATRRSSLEWASFANCKKWTSDSNSKCKRISQRLKKNRRASKSCNCTKSWVSRCVRVRLKRKPWITRKKTKWSHQVALLCTQKTLQNLRESTGTSSCWFSFNCKSRWTWDKRKGKRCGRLRLMQNVSKRTALPSRTSKQSSTSRSNRKRQSATLRPFGRLRLAWKRKTKPWRMFFEL